MNADEPRGCEERDHSDGPVVVRGAQVARLASVLADEWREEHENSEHDAAGVLDRLAAAFSAIEEMDEAACLVMLASLDVEIESEWALVEELRAAVESRAWMSHPSQRRARRPAK